MKRIAMCVAVFCLVMISLEPKTVFAKRGPAPEVKPVEANGYRYEANHVEMGLIEAIEIQTGIKRWDMKVYTIQYDDNLERDVQWVFIKELKVKGEELLVIDEKGQEYLVPLDLRYEWGPEGFDRGLRYSMHYARYKEGYIEIWVDAEETVGGVKEMKLEFPNGKAIASSRCWKAQRHINAPWACYFSQDQFKMLEDEKGTIQSFGDVGALKVEDEVDFAAVSAFAQKRIRFYFPKK